MNQNRQSLSASESHLSWHMSEKTQSVDQVHSFYLPTERLAGAPYRRLLFPVTKIISQPTLQHVAVIDQKPPKANQHCLVQE